MVATSPSTARLAADDLPAALEPILRSRIQDARGATIANWAPTERGFSTETFLFDVTGIEGEQSSIGLVFRRPPEFAILPDYDLRRQFLTMQRLEPSPIPVPAGAVDRRRAGCAGDAVLHHGSRRRRGQRERLSAVSPDRHLCRHR